MIIFSGIQPTGCLHLGNYLGAIKQWKDRVALHPEDQFIFSIVDLHSITIPQNPIDLKESILKTFATYLACGIEPAENVIIFQQSQVKEHAELAWLLACNTQLGWLDKMTQYKDKTRENKQRACLGLYAYPVLMAADILLYNTNLVPVGEDQVQHIELTRDIAIKMNATFGSVFTVPEYSLNDIKRVMSLKDPTKKMSKSDESDVSRINLIDSADEIRRKVQKATSTAEGIKNLQEIYKHFTGQQFQVQDGKYSEFKKQLADVLIAEISPIFLKITELMRNEQYLTDILRKGNEKARDLASQKIQKLKDRMGMN